MENLSRFCLCLFLFLYITHSHTYQFRVQVKTPDDITLDKNFILNLKPRKQLDIKELFLKVFFFTIFKTYFLKNLTLLILHAISISHALSSSCSLPLPTPPRLLPPHPLLRATRLLMENQQCLAHRFESRQNSLLCF